MLYGFYPAYYATELQDNIFVNIIVILNRLIIFTL